MKLYMAPGSCTTGIHILLEELGLPFEAWIISIPASQHLQPEYLALNPKGSIPTLVLDDGQSLTDYIAISYWLARRHPRARLMPDDALAAARVMEILAYVVGTVHGQGFARLFNAEGFAGSGKEALQGQGRAIVDKAFAILDTQLVGPYAAGEFSIADPALFYVEFWADKLDIPLPLRLSAHYTLMRSRPVVQQVLREEGYR
ncbi:glutathione S-transferase [Uliginosibacterium sp. IMCC34675]|uniref:Glutathione S-transferase n=2 Tax=Uliginosibacterium aquaticum TaxID=2731212 RepID=A0ABX2IJF3_9RHOO|nr:glutathione S-transferase [Uliginosibacterium aquaticum]